MLGEKKSPYHCRTELDPLIAPSRKILCRRAAAGMCRDESARRNRSAADVIYRPYG
jgi:hypothetical protein